MHYVAHRATPTAMLFFKPRGELLTLGSPTLQLFRHHAPNESKNCFVRDNLFLPCLVIDAENFGDGLCSDAKSTRAATKRYGHVETRLLRSERGCIPPGSSEFQTALAANRSQAKSRRA